MGSTLSVDTIQGATTAANVKFPSGTTVQAQSLPNSGRGAFVYTTSSSFEGLIQKPLPTRSQSFG